MKHAAHVILTGLASGKQNVRNGDAEKPSAPARQMKARLANRQFLLIGEGEKALLVVIRPPRCAEIGPENPAGKVSLPDLALRGSPLGDRQRDIATRFREAKEPRRETRNESRAARDRRASGKTLQVLDGMQPANGGGKPLPSLAEDGFEE